MIQGLIMTQSRAAWFAAILVIPLVTFLRYRTRERTRGFTVGLVGSVLLGGATLLVINLQTVTTRLSQEKEMFAAAWRGEFEAVPSAGFGVRVHAFRFGAAKWLERPFFGWGPGSTEYLISDSGLPHLRHSVLVEGEWREGPDWLDHLHNTYLEILVRFGLVGALLMISALGLLARGLWVAHREGRLPLDYCWFLTGVLGLMALWSLSDFRVLHPDWRSYWILVAGIMGTFRMRRGLRPLDDTAIACRREIEDVRRAP
jgi:O-antigen ligase